MIIVLITSVRPKNLVNFEDFARHHNVIIMLHDVKKDSGKDAGSTWQLVYGKIRYKSISPTVNIELLEDHYFYIKKMDLLCRGWECKTRKQTFTREENLKKHLK